MKKTLFKFASILLFISLFVAVGLVFHFLSSKINRKPTEEIEESITSVFEDSLKPVYGSPKKILIESLNLKLDIETVGVDSSGYLETPKGWNVAGWYKKSARPAEIGNLIINGHYDDSQGKPAAFWQLKNLKVDDKVTVLDSYGKSYDYKVVDLYFIDINDPERLKVFETENLSKSAMTLITCGGVWLPGEGTYNKRLVVNAELISR